MNLRIIPRLDIKGPNLVKGIHLEGLRILGNPQNYAEHYYNDNADEIIFLDSVASLYGRNSLHEIIRETAKNIFIPMTVGGGIRTLDDIKIALDNGADKVAINSQAIRDKEFIKKAIGKYGASTITISITAKKNRENKYDIWIDNGRTRADVNLLDWLDIIRELKAGEIIITSIDQEGTGKGMDSELINIVSDNSEVPVIVSGGVGNIEDIIKVASIPGISGICIASVLHYGVEQDSIQNNTHSFEFKVIGDKIANKRINPCSLNKVKEELSRNNIDIRV